MIFLALALGLIGCRGKQGDKGDNGIAGMRGGQIVDIGGNVTSDDFTVIDPRLKMASVISLYLSDGKNLTESPYFLPSLGINTYYLFDASAGTIRIFNGQKALALGYIIAILM